MFSLADKGRKRSYLLPGAGGRAHRRKQNLILTCSVIIGLGVAVILATLMYWLEDRSDDFAETRAFIDRCLADVARLGTAREHLEAALARLPNPFRLFRAAR